MSMPVYIGVDGGGTHARAVAVAEDGRELARRTGPAGIVDPRDPGHAATVVAQLARDVLLDADVRTATALCCGLAGAGRPQQREAVRVALVLEHVADRVMVVGDAEAAMADAFPHGAGVLVVAGTGSMAWGRGSDGDPVRVGGWGMILGDEGSGFDIGLAGLRQAVRSHDGRVPASTLTRALLAAVRLDDAAELIAWAASASKAQVAALAPVVLDCAGQGDAAASAVRDNAVQEIALLAMTAARRAGVAAPAVALTGGLIADGGPLRDAVSRAIGNAMVGASIIDRPVDAALGAARLARGLPVG